MAEKVVGETRALPTLISYGAGEATSENVGLRHVRDTSAGLAWRLQRLSFPWAKRGRETGQRAEPRRLVRKLAVQTAGAGERLNIADSKTHLAQSE